MGRENTEVVDRKDVVSENQADNSQAGADLSRQAWEDMKTGSKSTGDVAEAPKPETNERGGVIARDAQGNITRVDYPDGVTYEYSKFDGSGNPTRIKITDHKDGDFGQWNKEGDGLWRSYNKDKPNYEVVVGEWKVDRQGVMHMDGHQDTKELPAKDTKGYTEKPSPKVTRDDQGRITQVDQPNGVKYQYSNFDESGQPTRVKITEKGSKEFGEWVKERDGLWRAHHNGKPTSEVIVGEWIVNEKGEMRHTGHQDMQPVTESAKPESKAPEVKAEKAETVKKVETTDAQPVKAETNERGGVIARDAEGRITRVDYPDGVTYEYNKFDGSGNPTRIKITDHKTGDFGQWNKEGEGLWRSYSKDKPNYEVVVGEWRVDKQGVMHMDGQQDSRPLPEKDNKGYTEQAGTKLTRDANGRITQVEDSHGVKHEYSKFDENGQPTNVKITQKGSSEYGEWKKEKDGLWRAYHNGKPTSEVIVGEWKVNEKGEMSHTGYQDMQPVERTSHSAERKPVEKPVELKKETAADGSVIGRLPDGKIGSVEYPDRGSGKVESRTFKYDAKGELSEVKQHDGSTLKKGADGKWHARLPDGSKGAIFDSAALDDKGNFTYEMTGSKLKFSKAADGSSTMESGKDGTLVKFDKFDRPVESTNASGTRKFEYNDKHELTSITHADGTKFVKDGTDSWKEFGKDGKETGKVWKGKVDSDLIGGIVYKEAGSDETISELTDGTKFIEKKDGSTSQFSPDGKLKSVDYPSGQRSEFKYAPDGTLNEVKFPGGTVYTTTDGKEWTNAETGVKREMKLEATPDGRLILESEGKKVIMWTDGEVSNENIATGEFSLKLLNGSRREFPKDAYKPSKVITAEGREFVFDSNDDSIYEIKSGDTLGLIARDLLIANNTTDKNFQPTREQVAAAVQELANANGITNVNVITRGQKLKVPSKLLS